jgi:Peptidase family M48
MTIVLAAVAVVILCMPGWLAPLTKRLDPHEALRICVAAVVIGAFLVELSLILFSVPVVFRALGMHSVAVSCHCLSVLSFGGLWLGWFTAPLAVLLPVLWRRGWMRARADADEMRAEPALGSHSQLDGIDLVRLPTDALVAYSIGDPNPQIVVSDGLVSLLASDELDVVVGHEVAHVRERHGRILRLLAGLEHPLPSLRWVTAPVRVAMERGADEIAVRRDPLRREALLDALMKVTDADVPVAVAAFTQRSGVVERATALLVAPPVLTRLQRVNARLALGGAATFGVAVAAAWAFAAHLLLLMIGVCCH